MLLSISAATIDKTKVRIWYKQHKSMDLSWLESTVQAGGAGVMVWQMFSGHTIGPIVSPEYCLNARACLSIAAVAKLRSF